MYESSEFILHNRGYDTIGFTFTITLFYSTYTTETFIPKINKLTSFL